MFGVIPRVVWSKCFQPDDLGRITLAQNCLLLERAGADAGAGTGPRRVLIESGSGDKLGEKPRKIFGLTDRTVLTALAEIDIHPSTIDAAIVTHLHFDHAGGLTRRALAGESPDWTGPCECGTGVKLSFPNAPVYVQRREWEDATANRSVMTRTYLKENLEPLRGHLRLLDAPLPFPPGHVAQRDELPSSPASSRFIPILPGIDAILVPGHTWGQQAIRFTDTHGRSIVFTPDVLPTIHHAGAAYNLAYDVEPYTSTLTRHWFLDAAAKNDWVLILDHEPGNPLVRVRADDKDWYRLIPESPPA
jgi:glyoxylase-like metal-dependent hydrolase (beta-lactamase superfamily II)